MFVICKEMQGDSQNLRHLSAVRLKTIRIGNETHKGVHLEARSDGGNGIKCSQYEARNRLRVCSAGWGEPILFGTMKVLRFMLGLFGYFVVWILVTGLGTLLLHPLLPGKAPDPIGVDWAAIPGGFVGALVGYRIFQMLSRDRLGGTTR